MSPGAQTGYRAWVSPLSHLVATVSAPGPQGTPRDFPERSLLRWDGVPSVRRTGRVAGAEGGSCTRIADDRFWDISLSPCLPLSPFSVSPAAMAASVQQRTRCEPGLPLLAGTWPLC